MNCFTSSRFDGFHPIQERLAEHNGSQCGYCSPGFVMNMYRSVWEGLSVHATSGQFGLGCLCTSVIYEFSVDCILCACLISGHCQLDCLVISFIRFLFIGSALHRQSVPVIYHKSGLGNLFISLVQLSVEWAVYMLYIR